MTGSRRGVVAALVLGAVGALGACSASRRDYAEQAQRFIASDDEVTARYGVEFSDVECEPPGATEPGATFTCTASGDDDQDWAFTVTIAAASRYVVAGTPNGPAT